jgi:hypothetical protein
MKIGMAKRVVRPQSRTLLEAASNVTSQFGEDGIIEKIFTIIAESNRYAVEFGAWDGKKYSNTYHLIQNRGWGGLLIEGNPEKFKQLQNTYAGNKKVGLVNALVGIDAGDHLLDEILAEAGAPSDLDLLSIDIDGCDYFVWQSLKKFHPRLLVIEFNPTCPNDVLFVQDRDLSVNQGCSLLALVTLGKEKGYELVCATNCNALFVKAELFPLFKIADNSIWALYDPACDGRIFHGYDGTIHVVGMPQLMWHGIPLSDADFQVLPAAARKYRDAQR